MGLLKAWNWASGMGAKVWRGAKKAVGDVYHPISKIVKSVKSAENFIDGLLDKAVQIGVPSTFVDIVRDNPLYQGLHGAIDFADDLVNRDLPKYGGMIGDLGDSIIEGNATGQDVLNVSRNLGDAARGYARQGFTPNRMASSRGAMSGV